MSCSYLRKDKETVMSGIYCDKKGRVGNDFWRYYCESDCGRCPYNGGDDPYELAEETRIRKRQEEEQKREKERREKEERIRLHEESKERARQKEREIEAERQRKASEGSYTSYDSYASDDFYHGTGDYSGSSSGYSGGSLASFGKVILIAFVIAVVIVICSRIGVFGPWVSMDIPEGSSVIENSGLRIFGIDGNKLKSNSKKFGSDGNCKVKAPCRTGEVYFEGDGMSVWLGTADLLTFNTAVVESITYDEIIAQYAKIVIIDAFDNDGNVLADNIGATATDDMGAELDMVRFSEERYAVIISGESQSSSVELSFDGYENVQIEISSDERLSSAKITVAKSKEVQ